MRIRMKIKDIKNNIKWKFQKMNKGYCTYDLYDIDGWFIDIFPRMLQEFAENTIGYPCCLEELKTEVTKMPELWIQSQRYTINKIGKNHDINTQFDLNDGMCCWLLIILRMKYCFTMCNETYYNIYERSPQSTYEYVNKEMEKHKKEAFYLFEKYFFNLWW